MDFLNRSRDTLFKKQEADVPGVTRYFPESWQNDHLIIRIVVSALLFFFVTSQISQVYKAKTSELSKIPGPWYAPYTTLHLRYYFAKGTIWKYASDKHKQYGPFLRLGPRQIWVSEKEALKDILQGTDLPKVTMYAEISRERTSPGLFGEIRAKPHQNLKRFLGPAFTISSVDNLDNFFMDCVSKLIKNYYREVEKKGDQKGVTVDLMHDLHCLALDIMGESAFGKGFGQIDKIYDPSLIKTKEDKEWAKIPDAIFDGQAKRYGMVYVKRMLRKMGLNVNFDWPKEMTSAISNLINERRGMSDYEQQERRQDILQHMLTEGARPDTGVRMNNQDIIDQMSELLLAGSETTSGTIGCIFLEIARNPKSKQKLLDSLPILGKDDAVLDSKTVREDPQYRYLEACIKEGLRMHPIASEMGRRTIEQPHQFGDYVIPPYTVVSASYRNLHLNEKHWPEADRFWPERWLEDDEERGDAPKPDEDSYYPFSAGKHSCIGKNFAYAEIRTVTANIFSRFDVEEADKDKIIDFRQFITMQFHDGSWKAKMIPRSKVSKAAKK